MVAWLVRWTRVWNVPGLYPTISHIVLLYLCIEKKYKKLLLSRTATTQVIPIFFSLRLQNTSSWVLYYRLPQRHIGATFIPEVRSQAVYLDAEIKSGPNCFKSCPKCCQISFYLKRDIFKSSPKVIVHLATFETKYFTQNQSLPRTLENCPIWSQRSWAGEKEFPTKQGPNIARIKS